MRSVIPLGMESQAFSWVVMHRVSVSFVTSPEGSDILRASSLMKFAALPYFIGILLVLGPWVPTAHSGIEPPVLRVSLDMEPLTVDWNGVRTSTDRFIASFLMRGLLKVDATNQPVCDLCSSYAVSADGKTLRFELNAGEEWSDGVKLEARHFVDSFHRLLNPSNHFKAAEEFRDVVSVRAESKTKLEISLSRPVSIFPHLLTTAAVYPIRKELLKSVRESGENHASTAVLGPYQLAAWEHGKRVVIEGNPAFKGERPVYRVDFVLGTHAQLLAKFKDGKLDILSNPTGEDLMKLPGQKLQVSSYWATRDLLFNVRHAPVSDVSFRKAVLHALERDGLPAVLRNGERKVTGLIPPGLLGYRELPLVTADLAQAQHERAQAVPDSKPVELSLLVRDIDSDRHVAEWMSTQLERIKVRIKIHAVSSGSYLNELEQGRFDLALATWSFNIASPVEILRSFETKSLENRGAWTNVGFDALLGQLVLDSNSARSAQLVDQLTQILEIKDVAVIPLGYPTQPFILGPRVVSFAITPYGDPDLVRIQLKL